MLVSIKTPESRVIELGRINCGGCVHCCRFGGGFLGKQDAQKIARFLRITEKELKEKYLEEAEKFNTILPRPRVLRKKNMPYGKCVFLDEKHGCTIHEAKPLQCRIGTCDEKSADLQKWFDFHHFLNPEDPESVRQYAVWLEFNEPLPGAKLEEIIPDKKKLKKILEYEVIK